MRVLIVTNMYPSPYRLSSGIFIMRQVEALQDLGIEVEIARAIDDRHKRSLSRWYGQLAWDTFKKIHLSFDLVHVHYPMFAGIYGGLVSTIRRKPLILTLHGGEVDEERYVGLNRLKKQLVRSSLNWTLHRANAVIAVGKYLVDLTIGKGVPREKISVIDMGVDLRIFQPREKEAASRQLGLPVDEFRVVCVANLKPVKGHRYLIEAAYLLRDKYPQLRWYFVGGGSLEQSLRMLVSEFNLENRVYFVGQSPVNEVPLWDAAADVLVMSSINEPFGLAALEAMACSRPVIASNVGGLPDFVIDGYNGFLVPPADPKEIANRVELIMASPALAKELGQRGIETARQHEVRVQARRVYDIYCQIVR